MTPKERAHLQAFGGEICVLFYNSIGRTLLYGIFMVLVCGTTYLTIKKGLSSFSTRVLLVLSILSFLAASIGWSISLADAFLYIHGELVANPGIPLTDRHKLIRQRHVKLIIASNCFGGTLPLLTDLVTVWRGAVLFPERRWGTVLAVILCAAGLVISIVEQVLGILYMSNGKLKPLRNALDIATVVLSFATNLIATGLIAYGVWLHRKHLVANLNKEERRPFRVYKILTLLVESGIAYCGIQGTVMIIQFIPWYSHTSVLATTYAIFSGAYFMLSAMYPTLVVFIVKHRGNFLEAYSYHPPESAMRID